MQYVLLFVFLSVKNEHRKLFGKFILLICYVVSSSINIKTLQNFSLNLYWVVYSSNFQTFLPIILYYKRGNFVYHPSSYPLKSLIIQKEYRGEDEMPNRCGFIHIRSEKHPEQDDPQAHKNNNKNSLKPAKTSPTALDVLC